LQRIAIIGLGPWGVCALERVVTTARRELPGSAEVEVHVIEPGTPGSGVYDVTQPDYLLLNNPCSQLSLYPFATEDDQPPYGIGLYDWAVARGYRWVGDRCVIDAFGRPIEPHHFLPRRLMGEYLQWFYRALVAGAPSGVEIVHHPTSAVDLVARTNGTEEVRLANGRVVAVDHVIVTSGHTANRDAAHRHERNPYPVASYVNTIPSDATVAVAGMGLVALDVVTALTVGRGGEFVEDGAGLRYRRSGREPTVQLFSRSGLPFTAKPVTGIDRTNLYKPLICTPDRLDALNGGSSGHRRPVDMPGTPPRVRIRNPARRPPAPASVSSYGTPGTGIALTTSSLAWPLASAASTPRRSSSAISRSTNRATTMSGSFTKRWSTTCGKPRFPMARAR
jgi:uncharacterized NAD(P)/FAD-binding protein YdhS